MMSGPHVQFNVAIFDYRYFIFNNKSRQLLSINYILCRRCLAAANAEITVSTLMLCITSFSSERSERLISRALSHCRSEMVFENHLSPLHEPHVVAYNNVPAAARPAILLILIIGNCNCRHWMVWQCG